MLKNTIVFDTLNSGFRQQQIEYRILVFIGANGIYIAGNDNREKACGFDSVEKVT
jgi:hypothetical protein